MQCTKAMLDAATRLEEFDRRQTEAQRHSMYLLGIASMLKDVRANAGLKQKENELEQVENLLSQLTNRFEDDETKRAIVRLYCNAAGLPHPKWGPA